MNEFKFCEVSRYSISNRLKVSAVYLEKQKSFIPKKSFLAVVSKYAKRDPRDGVSCPNFH